MVSGGRIRRVERRCVALAWVVRWISRSFCFDELKVGKGRGQGNENYGRNYIVESENNVDTVAVGCQIDTRTSCRNPLALGLLERPTLISMCPSLVERRLGTLDGFHMEDSSRSKFCILDGGAEYG